MVYDGCIVYDGCMVYDECIVYDGHMDTIINEQMDSVTNSILIVY